jgi:hypothetical protein
MPYAGGYRPQRGGIMGSGVRAPQGGGTGADVAGEIIQALSGGVAGVIQTAAMVHRNKLLEQQAAEDRQLRVRADARAEDEMLYRRGQDRITRERQDRIDAQTAGYKEREFQFKDRELHQQGMVDEHGAGAAMTPTPAGTTPHFDPALSAKEAEKAGERTRRVEALVRAYPHIDRSKFEAHIDDPDAIRRLTGLQKEGGSLTNIFGAGAQGALNVREKGAASLKRQADELQQDADQATRERTAAQHDLEAVPEAMLNAETPADSDAVRGRARDDSTRLVSARAREDSSRARYVGVRQSADSAEADVQRWVQGLLGQPAAQPAAAPGARQVVDPFRDTAPAAAPVPPAMQVELDGISKAAAELKKRGVPDAQVIAATQADVAALVKKYGYGKKPGAR